MAEKEGRALSVFSKLEYINLPCKVKITDYKKLATCTSKKQRIISTAWPNLHAAYLRR